MRATHLNLAATGILVCGLALAIHKSGDRSSHHPVMRQEDAGERAVRFAGEWEIRSRGSVGKTHHDSSVPGSRGGVVAESSRGSAGRTSAGAMASGVGLTDEAAGHPLENPPSCKPGSALQLAGDVRLPAAIMAQADTDPLSPHWIAPAAEKANQAITEKFYRDLLSRVDDPMDPAGADTIVVRPGREVEAASFSADEAFRALFGDAAYNRQSMRSAIEVRLPELPP